jgi:hypothetical protein
MAILKSRFGKSGIIFEDIIFDNSTIQIDMSQNSQGTSFLNHGEVKEQRGNDRVKEVMELAMEQKRRELEDLNN